MYPPPEPGSDYGVALERHGTYWLVVPVAWTRNLLRYYRIPGCWPDRENDGAPFPLAERIDLVNTHARFQLTRSEADKIWGNHYPGHPYGIRAIVLHVTEGTTEGSLA
jgi:hypothetical protein